MEKDKLKELILSGKTYVEIGEYFGVNYRTVSYHIKKLDLFKYTREYKKQQNSTGDFFEKIDTKEKAYILGFILGDGAITEKDYVDLGVALRDKEVLDFISGQVKGTVHIDNTFNKATRRYPRARISKKMTHLVKHLGSRLKPNRHFPRINKELERYLVLGFFDADGCFSYGKRKDRNRYWASISFTHHLNCLEGFQKFIYKTLDISSIVRKKTGEEAYLIDISSIPQVIKFLEYLYPSNEEDRFIILQRKYNKIEAGRRELEEFGERKRELPNTEPSQSI